MKSPSADCNWPPERTAGIHALALLDSSSEALLPPILATTRCTRTVSGSSAAAQKKGVLLLLSIAVSKRCVQLPSSINVRLPLMTCIFFSTAGSRPVVASFSRAHAETRQKESGVEQPGNTANH